MRRKEVTQVYEKLFENSLAAALSSIEIYNKPDFKYREEIFTILIINAWELLLKAKILKDTGDNLTSLYIMDKGSPKCNRSGMPLTIDIIYAMNIISINKVVVDNIRALVDIRDTAVHFYHDDVLSYVLYTLGVASLINYQKLTISWFGKNLLEYNFYILPLGFIYNFKTLSMLDLSKSPQVIANLIKSVTAAQSLAEQSNDFHFACELSIEMKSAKHFSSSPDISAAIDPTAKDAVIVQRLVNPIHKYPLTYIELCKKVKGALPHIKLDAINNIIRDHNIKSNLAMSHYVFRSQTQEEKYKKTGTVPVGVPSIYNEDAVRYIVAALSSI